MRLLYFWVDYVLGHLVLVRPLLAQGGLVTFDRYFDDFLIDQHRYRLSVPSWLLRAMVPLVPKPNLIFVLDAPAEVLRARRQELTPEEIETQMHSLRNLAARYPNARLVRVDRAMNEIIDELERETLRYLDARVRGRLGWPQSGDLRNAGVKR